MTPGDGTATDPRRHPERIPRPPEAVRWIVQTLEDEGFEAWAVGGAVRDTLLGLPGKDWDLTTSARPERVQRLFRRTVPVGVEHGTVGVLARDGVLYEVTTFRRDVETDGRHAVVAFADSVDEDLARRDFTINSIAWHPLRRELRDPFGGVDDLEAGVVRTVGVAADRFAEDYLRVLRALRFAGRYGMEVHQETWEALVAARGELVRLSPERVREELLKVLGLHTPSAALALYAASGVADVLLPEIVPRGEGADPERAPIGSGSRMLRTGGGGSEPAPLPGMDRWGRTLMVLDALPWDRPLHRLALLLHGAGLPPGDQGRRARVTRALGFLERLRFSNQQLRQVAALVDGAGSPPPAASSTVEFRRFLARTGREPLPALGRIWLAEARVASRVDGVPPGEVVERVRGLRRAARSGDPLALDELALDGRGLIRMGLKPGPRFRPILEHLLECVILDPSRNRREWLEVEVERWIAREGGKDG